LDGFSSEAKEKGEIVNKTLLEKRKKEIGGNFCQLKTAFSEIQRQNFEDS